MKLPPDYIDSCIKDSNPEKKCNHYFREMYVRAYGEWYPVNDTHHCSLGETIFHNGVMLGEMK